jgi:putative transposase
MGIVENRNNYDLVLITDNELQFKSQDFQSRFRNFDISNERRIINRSEKNA